MKQAEKLECHTGSGTVLRGGIEASAEKLKVSGDFSRTSTIAQRNIMNAVGMKDTKPNVDRGWQGAMHAGVIEVNPQAKVLERGQHK